MFAGGGEEGTQLLGRWIFGRQPLSQPRRAHPSRDAVEGFGLSRRGVLLLKGGHHPPQPASLTELEHQTMRLPEVFNHLHAGKTEMAAGADKPHSLFALIDERVERARGLQFVLNTTQAIEPATGGELRRQCPRDAPHGSVPVRKKSQGAGRCRDAKWFGNFGFCQEGEETWQ
jgi:hypothetical protein